MRRSSRSNESLQLPIKWTRLPRPRSSSSRPGTSRYHDSSVLFLLLKDFGPTKSLSTTRLHRVFILVSNFPSWWCWAADGEFLGQQNWSTGPLVALLSRTTDKADERGPFSFPDSSCVKGQPNGKPPNRRRYSDLSSLPLSDRARFSSKNYDAGKRVVSSAKTEYYFGVVAKLKLRARANQRMFLAGVE